MLELDEVQRLRDEALIERLTLSVRNDRRLAVRLLVEMGEVQERGLYRDLGFSSMFEFATRRLGMSDAEAALRIRAAKVGRSFPVALEMLGRCEVNLTTLSLLAPVLTEATIHLLHEARFKTKQEVQALIAAHFPKPDAPDSVRRLASPPVKARAGSSAAATADSPLLLTSTPRDVHAGTSLGSPQATQATQATQASQATQARAKAPQHAESQPRLEHRAGGAGEVQQLSAERHRISFTGSQRVRELLQEAQDLRRRRYPAGDLEPLFERALELLVAEEKKKRFALTEKPRARTRKRSTRHSRYIPFAVRRQVWTRDVGRCCFVGTNGRRCQARSRLQFHHVVPFERGGATSAGNLVLFCEPHNSLQAERDYGRARIRQRIEERSSGSGSRMITAGRQPELARRQARGP